MEESIYNIIKKYGHKGINIERIESLLSDYDSLIKKSLFELEMKKKIFKQYNGLYTLFPDNYSIGEIKCNHKGQRFVLYNNDIYYIPKDEFNSALDFDTVVFEPNFQTKRARVISILERKNNRIVCEVVSYANKKKLVSINTPDKINIIIDEKELDNYVIGDRLIIEIQKESYLSTTKGNVIKLIGHKDDLDIDEITIAASKGFNTTYSEEYMKELSSIPKKVTYKDFKGRIDLTKNEIFTIDCDTTKDIDDAISLEIMKNGNYLLGVHIADVSHYIKPGTVIFKEAFDRGTSVYLGSSVNPMFHHILSNGICSLNEGENRLTKSVFMEINSKGEVVNYKIERTVINSKKKMTYSAVNSILKGEKIEDGYETFLHTLFNMEKLSNIMSHKKEQNGYIEFDSSEIKTITDEYNNAIGFTKDNKFEAEKIIENFMVYANEVIASHYSYYDVPFIYRVHDIPNIESIINTANLIKELGYNIGNLKNIDNPKVLQDILNELSKKDEYSIMSNLFLRTMSRAKYSTNNIGHYALGSENYTHFTSPIRRLNDLIVHTLIDIYDQDNIDKIDFVSLEKRLKNAASHATFKEIQEEKAEEELNRLRMAQYAQNFIGEHFFGRISQIYPDEIQVILDQNIYGVVPIDYIEKNNLKFYSYNRSLIGYNTGYLIGNKVEVKITGVSIEDKKVYFSIEKNLSLTGKPKIKTLSKQRKNI